ncbi:MAG: double-strand break repair helicase AddA [Brevundimonas sp.]
MSGSAQRQAADPALSVFVAANAGSGKTTTLVDRVARLLLTGVEPGAILCVTYTKAAAAEMQTRLFDKLGAWALADDGALTEALVKLDGRDPSRVDQETLAKARRLFARALETPGGLKIQTLHALCEALLRRFPVEAGVSPRFEVLEDARAQALSRHARDDLAEAALADPDGPIGKAYAHFAVAMDHQRFEGFLKQLEERRADLAAHVRAVEAGEADDPFALTGADADRTAEVVAAEFLAEIDPRTWRSCAEALAASSKRDADLGVCMLQVLEKDWSHAAMRPVFAKASDGTPKGEDYLGTRKIPEPVRARLLAWQAAWFAAKDEIAAWTTADETVKALTLARAHAGFYETAKARAGALDFQDLVARTVELLTDRSSSAWVLYKLDGGVRHVLVDEAQDTAPEQWDIIRALTDDFFTDPEGRRTIFAVGDEKQSIYSFQGARPERLIQEGRAYRERVTAAGRDFVFAPLSTSYRSTPQVLEFVDALFGGDPARSRALSPLTGDKPSHTAMRTDPGCVELWPIYVEPATVERESWIDPVDQTGETSARKRLAADIAEEILRQVRERTAVLDKDSRQYRPCAYGDFLILVRRRDATFEEIIRALKDKGVPVAGADRLKLSEHIGYRDLISLMRFALYPHDDLSLAEILRGPLCDVDEDSLFELAGRAAKRPSLWRVIRDRGGERIEWAEALEVLKAARGAADHTAFGFVSRMLDRVDGQGRSGRARILARLGAEAIEVLEETLNQCLNLERQGVTDLESALGRLETAEVEVKRELEGPRGEVRIMTVHGAKGLEAPVVILPDTTGRGGGDRPMLIPAVDEDETEVGWLMCPSSRGDDCPAMARARAHREAKADAEAMRLLYVALTRARDRVIVAGRRSAKQGPSERSWWTAIAQTFDALPTTPVEGREGAVRFGPAPVTTLRPAEIMTASADLERPSWLDAHVAPDRAAEALAPSRLAPIRGAAVPSPLAAASGDGGLGRFGRGSLIHKLLERLPDFAPDQRAEAGRRMLAREPGLSDAAAGEILSAALSVIEDARFAEVFGPGSRAEVALAGRAARLPGTVAGRIDRLVVTPERVLIVDYKTQRPAPDRAEDADPAHVLQLAVYRAVLADLYPGRTVEAALVWTDGPKLTPVAPELMDRALERLISAASPAT